MVYKVFIHIKRKSERIWFSTKKGSLEKNYKGIL